VIEPHAAKQEFTLRLDLSPQLGPARFDRDALLQVLFNLVDNAVKHSRAAPCREIVVAARPAADGGVSIRIQDRGPGVPARDLERIFEPFYRTQRELTRTTQGTGIGLALVRGLVEQMHGTVAARNREDGGFEVEIVLPAA
jgi:signal transduction histidine kinase